MTETTSAPTETAESVEEFADAGPGVAGREHAADRSGQPTRADRGEEEPWQRARELQKKLYDGGFAGICFPREYGGLGFRSRIRRRSTTSPAATRCRSSSTRRRSRSAPRRSSTPASEEQKQQHISAALRGDEVLVQLLSEPSGGSDLAGVITRADRKGDKWVINGARRGAPARSPPTTA